MKCDLKQSHLVWQQKILKNMITSTQFTFQVLAFCAPSPSHDYLYSRLLWVLQLLGIGKIYLIFISLCPTPVHQALPYNFLFFPSYVHILTVKTWKLAVNWLLHTTWIRCINWTYMTLKYLKVCGGQTGPLSTQKVKNYALSIYTSTNREGLEAPEANQRELVPHKSTNRRQQLWHSNNS